MVCDIFLGDLPFSSSPFNSISILQFKYFFTVYYICLLYICMLYCPICHFQPLFTISVHYMLFPDRVLHINT